MIGIARKTLFFLALYVIVHAVLVSDNNADPDLWHRLAAGRVCSMAGHPLWHDIFAYSPTKPLWVDHEWGTGVVFYFTSLWLGDWGLVGLQIALCFGVILMVYLTHRLMWPEARPRKIEFYALALLAIYPGVASAVRSQAFTYFFFALWLYLLERLRRGRRGSHGFSQPPW